jgi:hypothetical protein
VRPQACASIFQTPSRFAESVRKDASPNDALTLNRDGESRQYDSIRGQPLDIPESHLVGQVLCGDTKVVTPFLYVSEPIGRSIRIQPAIGCDAVDDNGWTIPTLILRRSALAWFGDIQHDLLILRPA